MPDDTLLWATAMFGTLMLGSAATASFIPAADPSGHDGLLVIGRADAAAPGVSLLHWWDVAFLLLAILVLAVVVRHRAYRLDAAPRRAVLFEPAVGFALVLAMFVLGIIGRWAAQVVFRIAPPEGEAGAGGFALLDQGLLTAGVYAFQLIVVAVYARRLAAARRPMPDMRPSHGFAALAGLVWMVLLWPVLAVVAWGCALVMTLLRGEPPDQLAHETLRAMVSEGSGAGLLLMSLLVVLVTPVIEEVLYRGLLQDAIRRVGFGRWPAIVTASLFFSFMHWDAAAPHALLALFVLSLGLGWAYEKTGRLTAPIVMHVLFNLGNLTLALITS